MSSQSTLVAYKSAQDTTEELANDTKLLVYRCEVRPHELPQLVEENPQTAVDILTKLIKSPEETDEYYNALVSMDLSLNSMEVVDTLATEAALPKNYILMYITSCILSCEKAKHQDEYMHNRLARLACIFMQNLIRNEIMTGKDLDIHQVEAFCMEFSWTREAAGLLRLLKTLG